MKTTLIVSIILNDTDIIDPSRENLVRETWRRMRSALGAEGSRCDYDEGNQERRALFLLDQYAFTRLLSALPPLPSEILLAVYTLASPDHQFVEQDAETERFDPTNYHLKMKKN